ncbi:CPA1 family monovalent cation:H+ antiporter [Actinoplanes lutulentus]|uniref:Sodium/proton antiporter (CPA1 family) n=1 Tax=Actinoplanes lutulentus TaxID=1287878 RepID=A0A327Z0Q1_9ACTN|nr:Na+/H+ antiporter [Actinoplanes lutulentus]MBB2947675.1 CPA1 family monovalent cation:H+ antiporter [Actinoplanes lutulentus]RAK27731.1 sodium/proton antiporter (CPA1 family) [Actinoplanes lutulentus]
MSVEHLLAFVLAAVAVVVLVRWIANHTGLPAAAMLPVIGVGYALLPGPNISLDPDVVLTFVLPPLLYSAALDSSLLGIRRNLRTVVSLSVVLVLLTALLIGLGFAWFVTGATLAAGIAVGAAVAPPDPVAALAVGRKAGLPPRIVTLIQGEGLLNDATALTILSVAVAAAVGGDFSATSALGQFVIAAVGGVVVGMVVAYVVRILSRPISGDPLIANAVSLSTPFCAYLIGEEIHVSGVLAVVVAGLIVGHHRPRAASGAGRLQTSAVWRLVDFLLEGLVFLLIGQQLPAVVRGLAKYDTSTIVIAVSITVGVVLLLRPLWLVLTQSLPRSLHTWLGNDRSDKGEEPLTGREVVAMSWTGTRGVISLAAIFTIPLVTESGEPFPDRDLLLFCTFVVVLVTLVGQGLTFGPLVRALKLRADDNDQARVRNEARSASVEAALGALDDLEAEEHDDIHTQVIDTMRKQLRTRLTRYRGRLALLRKSDSDVTPVSPMYEAALHVRRVAIDAQRTELLRWRDSGQLPDEGLRVLEHELDLEERLLPDRPVRR